MYIEESNYVLGLFFILILFINTNCLFKCLPEHILLHSPLLTFLKKLRKTLIFIVIRTTYKYLTIRFI